MKTATPAPPKSDQDRSSMKIIPALFEHHEIRRVFDEKTETWFFSVVDIIQVLIQQPDYRAARNYWKVLKNRLAKESSQSVTNCNQLKLPAADGKSYLVLRCYRRAGGGRFDAPKGHRSKAQGNALGIESVIFSSPERAPPPRKCRPFRAPFFLFTVGLIPRSLLRLGRIESPGERLRLAGCPRRLAEDFRRRRRDAAASTRDGRAPRTAAGSRLERVRPNASGLAPGILYFSFPGRCPGLSNFALSRLPAIGGDPLKTARNHNFLPPPATPKTIGPANS